MSVLVKNIFSYTGAVILQKVISFFYFTFVARTLGPSIAGTYFLGLSLAQLFGVLSDLGIGNYLIRESAQKREETKKIFGYFYGIKVIISLISYAGIVISAILLKYPLTVIVIASIAGVSVIIDALYGINYSALRGHQYLKPESVGVIAFQLTLAAVGLVILLTSKNIIFLALSVVFASTLNFFISLFYLKKQTLYRPVLQFKRSQFTTILKESIPFAFIAIFARLYTQTDIIMLSKIGCTIRDCVRDVGLYTVAVKATLVIQSLPLSFMASIYPALSESLINNHQYFSQIFKESLKFLAMFIVGIVVIFLSFGAPAVSFVWGNEFLGSVSPLAILLIGSILVITTFPCGAALNSAKYQKVYAIYTFIALGANVVLNIIFIPRWGIQGAAWASALGSSLLLILAMTKMARVFPKIFSNTIKPLGGIFISGVITLGVGKLLVGNIHFISGSLILFALYILLLFVTRVLLVSHLKILLSMIRHQKVTPKLEFGE